MKVELSQKTLEHIAAFMEGSENLAGISVDDWNDLKLEAMHACTSLDLDMKMQTITDQHQEKLEAIS